MHIALNLHKTVSASAAHLTQLYLGKAQGSPIHIVLFAITPTIVIIIFQFKIKVNIFTTEELWFGKLNERTTRGTGSLHKPGAVCDHFIIVDYTALDLDFYKVFLCTFLLYLFCRVIICVHCTCTVLLLFAWCAMGTLTFYFTADCFLFVTVKVLQQVHYWKY